MFSDKELSPEDQEIYKELKNRFSNPSLISMSKLMELLIEELCNIEWIHLILGTKHIKNI